MSSNQETSASQEPSYKTAPFESERSKTGNVIIIGMPASGKTSIGEMAARLLGKGFMDLDQWIEEKAKASIQDIFARSGEDGFRNLESESLHQLHGIRNHVISVGSGLVEDIQNWRTLQQLGITVYLLTTLEILAKRLARSARELEKRPLFREITLIEQESERLTQVRQRLDELYERRLNRFQDADLTVLNGLGTAEFVAQSLARDVKQSAEKNNTSAF